MERMSWSFTHERRLVNKHGMNRFNIRSTETFQIWSKLGIGAVWEEFFIKLPILKFGNFMVFVCYLSFALDKWNISNNLHSNMGFCSFFNIVSKSRNPAFDIFQIKHLFNDNISIFFIEVSLFFSETSSIDCELVLFWCFFSA